MGEHLVKVLVLKRDMVSIILVRIYMKMSLAFGTNYGLPKSNLATM